MSGALQFGKCHYFSMEINLLSVCQDLLTCTETIEYRQLELNYHKPVGLILATIFPTFWVRIAVLEFVKGVEAIIGLVNQNVVVVLIVYFRANLFERVQILLRYFHAGITPVRRHRLLLSVWVLRILHLLKLFGLIVVQLFILVVPLNILVLLNYLGIDLMPLYHQFEGKKVLRFWVDQQDFRPTFASSSGLLINNKFSPELEKCTSGHGDIVALGSLFEGTLPLGANQKRWWAVVGAWVDLFNGVQTQGAFVLLVEGFGDHTLIKLHF